MQTTKSRKKSAAFDSELAFTWKKMGIFVSIVWTTAKTNPVIFWSMVITTTLNSIISVLLPVAGANIVSAISSHGIKEDIFLGFTMGWDSWIYVCLILFGALIVVEYLTDYTLAVFASRVEIAQRTKILISLVEQDVDFFFDHVSGNIMTRLVGDTAALSMGIHQFLSNLLFCIVILFTAIFMMFYRELYLLGAIGFAYIFIVFAISTILFIHFRNTLVVMFDVKREIDADMTDRIQNITLIKSSGMEEYELNRTDEQLEIYNKKGNKAVYANAMLNVWVSSTVSFLTTLVTIVVAILAINGKLDGDVASILALAIPMVSYMGLPVMMIIPTLRAATRAANSAQRINELTAPIPTIKPNTDGKIVKKIDHMVFKDVIFAYPKKIEKVIIPKTTFTFEKGKSYAFVGETGSGKSTIGRLLLRYYEPISGQILINGQDDLNQVNLPSYLDKIGYVEQDPQIFFGNFIDNVRYGKFDATEKQVIAACKKAELHDFIMSLPEGYETILGQRGFLLSGGQKQRLVIARVFLKNPDLIILDEATSALDNIVEKEIQAQLDELIKDKTSITIAHRLSTIKNVDQIIVLGMDKGIVQTGTFEELIKKPGHFKRLYEAGITN